MSDFVEIDTLLNRVDDVRINGEQLELTHGNDKISFSIAHGSAGLIDASRFKDISVRMPDSYGVTVLFLLEN